MTFVDIHATQFFYSSIFIGCCQNFIIIFLFLFGLKNEKEKKIGNHKWLCKSTLKVKDFDALFHNNTPLLKLEIISKSKINAKMHLKKSNANFFFIPIHKKCIAKNLLNHLQNNSQTKQQKKNLLIRIVFCINLNN